MDEKLVEKCRLTDEELQMGFYKVSTSPPPFAFTEDDGTLVNPSVYTHVRVTTLLEAQLAKAISLIAEEIKGGLESLTYIGERDLFVEIDKNEWHKFWEGYGVK